MKNALSIEHAENVRLTKELATAQKEIEQLRKEVEQLKFELNAIKENRAKEDVNLQKTFDELKAENDRLVKREGALKQIITENTRSFARANELDATGELRNIYANQVEEIRGLRAEVERLKEHLRLANIDAINSEAEANDKRPALAEVLAKFTPPFRYDGREDVYDANGYALFLRITDEERPIVGTAIAEWLNKNVKLQQP